MLLVAEYWKRPPSAETVLCEGPPTLPERCCGHGAGKKNSALVNNNRRTWANERNPRKGIVGLREELSGVWSDILAGTTWNPDSG